MRDLEKKVQEEFDRWSDAGRAESMARGHHSMTIQCLDQWSFSTEDVVLDQLNSDRVGMLNIVGTKSLLSVLKDKSYSTEEIMKAVLKLRVRSEWEPFLNKWSQIGKKITDGRLELPIEADRRRLQFFKREFDERNKENENSNVENKIEKILDEIIKFCTQNKYVYSHNWRVGDVLIWDERSILHRGRPWPYSEPRTLASICVSMTENDGLALM